MRTEWYWNDRAELARRAECSPQLISALFNNRKAVSRKMAARIADAAEEMNIAVTRLDCLYPEETNNPLFGEGK